MGLKRMLGILTLTIMSGVSANAQSLSGPEQLQHFLHAVDRLQARFEQTLLDTRNRESTSARGILYLQRPRWFRWDYTEPENQQLVADGRQIWLYDPELEQVSVQSQESALQGTPALLLLSGDAVEEAFRIEDYGSQAGMQWVKLTPRDEESQFIQVLLAFDQGELRRMEMFDKFGQITRFQFQDIRMNPEFDSNLFRFVPPFDSDIYRR